ncbi:hypothetical protein [Mycoplasmopsis verecunda]|uniref:Uncharacterized protein n=1 Tax=Mycoplasmopsis verecunda TaxID=171291 RepID=A0A1T4LZT0_9BACT|nr:hypothetical protein [Mycoplasmopsis verecunda]WPB54593.1 hypothetical protein SAM46_00275 [Mycoplasmopsis verecunda]SJZ60233.1 hypothetical protein SAMN02745154_00589 [Mycoplasmopsis verecunda]
MIKSNDKDLLIEIEKLELRYLNKYYYFLKFVQDEMFIGFKTKEKIRDDWFGLYGSEDGKGISDFAVGAERIVYSLMNSKAIGQPNSAPVGSDMFFEVEDAFIHIDMKTVQTHNLNDFRSSIFIGKNQNSYKGFINIKNGFEKREYVPALPTFYNKGKNEEKICLSYFLTILYDRDNLDILVITLISMPNGELESYYKERVLCPGKNPDKARLNLANVNKFELLEGEPSRIKVIYFNEKMDNKLKLQLALYYNIYKNQIN